MPVQFKFLRNILDSHASALSPHVVGKALRVKGIVCQPGKFLPLHFPAPFAQDSPDFHFQVYPGIPTGHIPYPSCCLVVITPMHSFAASTCCFFCVLSSRITRAFGSPNIPCTSDRGRNPGNRYSSSNLLFFPICKSYGFLHPFYSSFFFI